VVRAQLRLLGVNEERMQRMEQQLASGGLDPRTDAMLRYARRLCRASPLVTPADRAPLAEAGIGPDDIREVAYVSAAVGFMNRMGTIPALPPQPWEKAPDQIVARLFRPLIAAMIRSWRKPGHALPQPLHPQGPFAALIGIYGDSPIGQVLGDALRDMWGSAVLPRRVKALGFAVIAHGLGAENAKREATRVLAEEGMTPEEITPLLANLGGRGLDATEIAVLSFARDSIWYEPQQIQKRAKQLHAQLTPPQFVEAIGVASLANAVCRLDSALVES
jgi:alkylhydroperoxidase family enzyme